MKRRHCLSVGSIVALLMAGSLVLSISQAQTAAPQPQWIWYPEGQPQKSAPAEDRYFRKLITLKYPLEVASFEVAADQGFELFVNGKHLGRGTDWKQVRKFDLSTQLKPGRNVLAIQVKHGKVGPAGLMVAGLLRDRISPSEWLVSDASWKVSKTAPAGWERTDFDDRRWPSAKILGGYGETAPWGKAPASVVAGRRFDAAPGFVVERVAGPELTGSVVRFQFDHRGRPLLSREGTTTVEAAKDNPGQGNTYVLDGRTADGKYTKAWLYSDQVKDCQGFFDLHGTVYCVGMGYQGPGIYRQTGPEGGPAAKVELLRRIKGAYEYDGPHQLLYGPDGKLHVCLSNFAYAEPYEKNSPHQHWYEGQLLTAWPDPRVLGGRNLRALGGTLVRSTDLTGQHWTLEAGGMRNEYGFAINHDGEVWTFDSDHEADIGLPWYRPNRILHCPPGAEFGWRTGTGGWPDYYADSLPAVVDVGRGCPTGMVFYHHHAYPEKYRGALFLGDWSLGRILVAFPKADGAGFSATFEVFLTGRPMPVTDLDVGPDGCLYFCTGGANTEGGLYRIRYVGPDNAAPAKKAIPGISPALAAALQQAQPESAWGLAEIAKAKTKAGKAWDTELLALVKDGKRDAHLRLRGLVLLRQFGPAPDVPMALSLADDAAPGMRAAAAHLLGDLPSEPAAAALAKHLTDTDPVVQRRCLESLLRHGVPVAAKHLLPLCGSEERCLRYLAHLALRRRPAREYRSLVLAEKNSRAAIYGMMALTVGARDRADVEPCLKKQLQLLRSDLSADALVELMRVTALTLLVHDDALLALHQEPRPRASTPLPPAAAVLGAELLRRFPHTDWRINREIARLCCRLETPGVQAKILAVLKQGSTREQQIHYAYCLRAVRDGWSKTENQQLLHWFCAAQSWGGGSNLQGYIDNMFEAWLKSVPPEQAALFRKEHRDRKPKEVEYLPLHPAQSKYAFDELVSYLEAHPGNARRGLAVLNKARCLACHRFGMQGEATAPDLTTVAQRFRRPEIVESLVYPSKVIADQYRGKTFVLKNGRTITGMPLAEKDNAVTILLPNITKETLTKADIDEVLPAALSTMPEGLLNDCSLEEIADLFALLEAGPAAQR